MKSANLRRMMSVAYVRNSNGGTPHNEGFKRTEIKQAITLLWISVAYIACQSPKVVPDFYEAINCDYQKVNNLCRYTYTYIYLSIISITLCKSINLRFNNINLQGPCRLPSVIRIIVSLSNLLVVVNSTSNFFIYIWKGVQFRRVLENKILRRHESRYQRSTFNQSTVHHSNTTRFKSTSRVTNVIEMNDMPRLHSVHSMNSCDVAF